MTATLRLYTVYWNPRDYPNRDVVRGFTIYGGSVVADVDALYIGETLSGGRHAILRALPGAVRLNRNMQDEAQILEVWL